MDLDPEIVKAELEKIEEFPELSREWEVATGTDWDDDPVVRVWAVVDGENIDNEAWRETWAKLRRTARERVREVARDRTNTAWWPLVRYRRAAAEPEAAA